MERGAQSARCRTERIFRAGAIGFLAVASAGGLQHVITCCAEKEWGFLIAGIAFTPLAVIHGFVSWVRML